MNPASIDASHDGKSGSDAPAAGMAVIVTKTAVVGVTGAAQANVPVISIAADGKTVLDSVTSDANGHASVKVEGGGSVTAVYAHVAPDLGNDFQTFIGVKPDDTLNFGGNTVGPAPSPMTGYTVTWSPFAGASYYDFYGPCVGGVYVPAGTTTFVVTNSYENASCHQDQMSLFVVAVGSTGLAIGTLTTGENYVANGSFSLGSLSPVTANLAVSFTGLDPSYTSISFGAEIFQQNREVYGTGNGGQPTGGAFTGTISSWPQFAGDRTLAYLDLSTGGAFSGVQLYDQFSTGNVSWTVASPPVTPQIAYDAAFISQAAGVGNWFTTGAGAASGQVVTSYWGHPVGANTWDSTWNLIVPPDALSVVFPQLPSPYKELTFQLQDQNNGFGLQGFLIPSVADYDAVRALPFFEVEQPITAVQNGVLDRVLVW